jgi:hypothetical protein
LQSKLCSGAGKSTNGQCVWTWNFWHSAVTDIALIGNMTGAPMEEKILYKQSARHEVEKSYWQRHRSAAGGCRMRAFACKPDRSVTPARDMS